MDHRFTLRPIGVIERPDEQTDEQAFFDPAREATIVIDERWEAALTGIEEYSHLMLLFWLDRAERPEASPPPRPAQGRDELPPVGLFATRSPRRPNPIGMSVVKLLRRDGRQLTVTGTDAWNGTPVLDLKGYNQRDDVHPEATVPAWLEQLWALHDTERSASR